MSDFIFCSKKIKKLKLKQCFDKIYGEEKELSFFSSEKSTFIISENIYNGFSTYVTDNHVCAVIGGPVLHFRNNNFISKKASNEGTKSIYDRWIKKDEMVWHEDLDGPFVIMLFDVDSGAFEVITDMLSFIPIFHKNTNSNIILSTHIDSIDFLEPSKVDQVSVADYIINNVVTFPFTIFEGVNQIFPASSHKWSFLEKSKIKHSYITYWLPKEYVASDECNVEFLANRLQKGLKNYMNKILEAEPKLGILMSGGEDSRTVAGMIPEKHSKDGFIYCETINNEVKITEEIAKRYSINLNVGHMSKNNFVDNMEQFCDLVGVGCDGANVHSFSFYKTLNYHKYDVIFGGFLADTFLKSLWSSKSSKRSHFFLFGAKENIINFSEYKDISHSCINNDLIVEVNKRRKVHWDFLKSIRPSTTQEWMGIWPISMQRDIPNIYGHRRLFRSFEPFTSSEVIKVGSIAPQKIKSNKILFQKAMKPFLSKTKWIPHNAGYLPYFKYWINNVLFKPYYKVLFRFFTNRNSTLANWFDVFKRSEVRFKEDLYKGAILKYCGNVFSKKSEFEIIDNSNLNNIQKRNILQLGYFLFKKNKF